MLKSIILTVLSYFVVANFIQAQATDSLYKKNLNTYWKYRARYLGTATESPWVIVGDKAGCSIPMSAKDPIRDCAGHWSMTMSYCQLHSGHGVLEWGDATVYLGFYILMLSLEYRNLEDAQQPTQETARELYYALKAFERLDYGAEVRMGLEGELNGFFLRDDVPYTFYLDSLDTSKKRFILDNAKQYECLRSDYSCEIKKRPKDGGYVSQDQALSLLVGFMAVCQFVPNGYYKDSTITFKALAQRYTDRIVEYMIRCKWRLKAPNGEKIPNLWGGDLRGMNYPIAKGAKNITQGFFRPTYQTGLSRTMGALVFSTFDWAFWMQTRNNHSIIFQSVILAKAWNAKKMVRRSKRADQLMYSLLYAAMHQKKLPKSFNRQWFEQWFAIAPESGPCFGVPNCDAPQEWRSSDRWWHNELKNGKGEMYFSGLDYLYTYNLYHYLYKNELPPYRKSE